MEDTNESVQVIWVRIKYQVGWSALKLKDKEEFTYQDQIILKLLEVLFTSVPLKLTILVRWHPSVAGCITLNSDGSCIGNPGAMGVGGVFRDHYGNFLADFSNFFGDGMNNKAELLGLLSRLRFATSFGFLNLDIEMDSMVVIKWLRAKRCSIWHLEDLWEDIQDLWRG